MKKISVIPGVWWVEIPEVDLRLLCGSPMDTVKHLSKKGLVHLVNKDGVNFETGPNAILLSERAVQGGYLWNLVEFPLMHMLFNQGMAIPNHPNNDGSRPIIIGFDTQIASVLKYVHRGFYGLLSKEEMKAYGIADYQIEYLWNIKLKFAGGNILEVERLVDTMAFHNGHVVLPGNVHIYHHGNNHYCVQFMDEQLYFDLKPSGKAVWYPSYSIDHIQNNNGNFSITHIGEGSGWNYHRPCMGSLISCEGKKYLVDCGPGLEYSINHLGIAVNEIDGIFFTHAHDDHIAGLINLITGDRKIDIYAIAPVMAIIRFKLMAVSEISEALLSCLININILEENSWTLVEGLEIKPIYSPHPMETTIMFFRAQAADGYKTYAHLADIVSVNILDSFVEAGVISSIYKDGLLGEYFRAVELKKIDAGGGLVHGNASDFVHDPSLKILVSHINDESGHEEFSAANFGDIDILISSHRDENIDIANQELKKKFPRMSSDEIIGMHNNKISFIPAGEDLSSRDFLSGRILFITGGCVSSIFVNFSRGALVGEEQFLFPDGQTPALKSKTGLHYLTIKPDRYIKALREEGIWEERLHILQKRNFLTSGSFPGKQVCVPHLDRLIAGMKERKWSAQQDSKELQNIHDELHIIIQGKLELSLNNVYQKQQAGSIIMFGPVIPGINRFNKEYSNSSLVRTVFFPGSVIRTFPSLVWALNGKS